MQQCHCAGHTSLFTFLFQAVYLDFCVGRVRAGSRWPIATEHGGNLRQKLFPRTWAGSTETRGTVQFRGPRWEAITTPGPEGQGQGVGLEPRGAAAQGEVCLAGALALCRAGTKPQQSQDPWLAQESLSTSIVLAQKCPGLDNKLFDHSQMELWVDSP